ncbi:MAG: hypothetical protein Q8O13_00325 [Candidatus Omnitrophota bacterium]|nr:hypothetical protein [Candidatus Omnitrophota bacterium]
MKALRNKKKDGLMRLVERLSRQAKVERLELQDLEEIEREQRVIATLSLEDLERRFDI